MRKIRLVLMLLVVMISVVVGRDVYNDYSLERSVEKCSSELEMTHNKRRMQVTRFASIYNDDPEKFYEFATRLVNIGHGLFGESSESFIVQEDGKRFTETRFEGDSVVGQSVDHDAVWEALGGRKGIVRSLNYRGVMSYIIYDPLVIEDYTWAFITEIDAAELAAGNCGI
ncbi:MAG: hypothetical protein OEM02_06845 [Desulfobulbaceae bacterium]|nr:hypothetical protein [Desulfobulbaceae bacterium]